MFWDLCIKFPTQWSKSSYIHHYTAYKHLKYPKQSHAFPFDSHKWLCQCSTGHLEKKARMLCLFLFSILSVKCWSNTRIKRILPSPCICSSCTKNRILDEKKWFTSPQKEMFVAPHRWYKRKGWLQNIFSCEPITVQWRTSRPCLSYQIWKSTALNSLAKWRSTRQDDAFCTAAINRTDQCVPWLSLYQIVNISAQAPVDREKPEQTLKAWSPFFSVHSFPQKRLCIGANS